MKKLVFSSIFFVLSITMTFAQKPAYMATMGKTLAQFATVKSMDDFQKLANKFGVIANAEKAEWLPKYYEAECYIIMSFMEQDANRKEALLDQAENLLDKIIEMEPNNAEVYALQSFYFTGRLVVNPMERGQKFGALSNQAIEKALAIDPENPRAQLQKIQMDMGSAPYRGIDPKSFCPKAQELLEKWDDFKPASPIHPNWGKDQLEKIVEGCE